MLPSELPSFRFLYDAAVEELGIKLVPGLQHEVAKGGFTEMFILKLATHEISDTMHIMGSTKLTNQSGKSKEADESFIPHSRPRGGWPSLVIEIGSPNLCLNFGEMPNSGSKRLEDRLKSSSSSLSIRLRE